MCTRKMKKDVFFLVELTFGFIEWQICQILSQQAYFYEQLIKRPDYRMAFFADILLVDYLAIFLQGIYSLNNLINSIIKLNLSYKNLLFRCNLGINLSTHVELNNHSKKCICSQRYRFVCIVKTQELENSYDSRQTYRNYVIFFKDKLCFKVVSLKRLIRNMLLRFSAKEMLLCYQLKVNASKVFTYICFSTHITSLMMNPHRKLKGSLGRKHDNVHSLIL